MTIQEAGILLVICGAWSFGMFAGGVRYESQHNLAQLAVKESAQINTMKGKAKTDAQKATTAEEKLKRLQQAYENLLKEKPDEVSNCPINPERMQRLNRLPATIHPAR